MVPGSARRFLFGASAGGALGGLCDALWVAFASTLGPSWGRDGAVAALDGLVLCVVAVAVVSPLVAVRRARRGRVGVAVGFLVVGLLHGVLDAITRDGPIALVASRRLEPRGDAPDGASNLVLVTFDTTRADHAFGSARARTPNLDRLARDGARFDAAIAQLAVTGPSHMSMLTGVGPWRHGALRNGARVPEDLPLLAETLRVAGWSTAAFVSAFVLDGSNGFSRGFEVYDDDFGWLQGWSRTLPGRALALGERRADPDLVLDRRAARTVDAALAWVATADEPFFLWVHLFDPHGPYLPPPPWDTAYYQGDPRDPAHASMPPLDGVPSFVRSSLEGITDVDYVLAHYAGEISYADDELGRLLRSLDEQGYASRTAVIAAGDHGESLGEHGVWFNHGASLFESETRVPLVVRFPGRVPAGVRVATPVELVDVAATATDLLGLNAPASVEGRSLLGPIFGRSSRPFARSLCLDREANVEARARGQEAQWRMVALRGPSSRYVYRESVGEAVYSLEGDELPVTPPDPARGAWLREQARGLLDAGSGGPAPELDATTRGRLEALGYVE